MLTYPAPDFISSLGQAFLARRLMRLSDGFVDDIEAYLRTAGLTAPARAFSTLLLLHDAPGLGIVQVARQVQMSHPLIINLLSQLEQMRLVRFEHDENDRRRRLIYLTEDGEREAGYIRDALPVIRTAYAELSRETGVDLWDAVNRLDEALGKRSYLQRLTDINSIRTSLALDPHG